jgi:hypothetical protein
MNWRDKAEGRAAAIALLVLSLLLALGLAEAVFRAGYFPPYFYDRINGLDLRFDRDIIYRIKPETRPDINNHGYRDSDFTPGPHEGQRIVFLGDSFIMALHVRPEETIPGMLERASGARADVYNMGVLGYGPDQSLTQIEREVGAFEPDVVVWSLYPTNDFEDLMLNRLFELDGQGRLRRSERNLVTANVSSLELLYQLQIRLSRLGVPSPGIIRIFKGAFGESNNDQTFLAGMGSAEARYRYKLMKSILKKAKDTLDGKGVRLLVVIIPSIWSIEKTEELQALGWPEARRFVNEDTTGRICDELGIESISLHRVFGSEPHDRLLYDHEDNHLSVYGHAVVANTIWAALGGH